MIARISLRKFRGYSSFEIALEPHAFLVGPNSAGKSTIVEVLALADKCIALALRRKPTEIIKTSNGSRRGWIIPSSTEASQDDPVRYEFGAAEARVSVVWGSSASLEMLWPEDDESGLIQGVFWLENVPGGQSRTSNIAAAYTRMYAVPVVTPLEHAEGLREPSYVKQRARTRLASRHFRNHLLLMEHDDELDDFKDFAAPWVPEVRLMDVDFMSAIDRLSVFYLEPQSRAPKELAWAGDGIQIWLQLLWHLYRAQEFPTIVLDEPEVYLHPDLQRRLVRLLEDLGAQIIMASHSSEVVTEASSDSVVWVDRRTRAGRRVVGSKIVSSLADALGSNYNVSLVKTLRTRTVLAVEGASIRTLRALARAAGAPSMATESDITVVRIQSFSTWASPDPLVWIAREVLSESSKFAVLLNMDLRPLEYNSKVRTVLAEADIFAHIWSARELANLLLTSTLIAEASGASVYAVNDRLDQAIELFKPEAQTHWIGQAQRFGADSSAAQLAEEFDDSWSDAGQRRNLVSPALVVDELNRWLLSEGYRSVSSDTLARKADANDLPLEVVSVLSRIESLVLR